MTALTIEIDISPWLDEEGLNIALFLGDFYVPIETQVSLKELIDEQIEAHTVAGKLLEPDILKGFIKSLRKAFKYAEKRVKELS